MSTYAFRAIDVAGIPSRGEMDAESKTQVSEELRERGLIVLDVEEQSAPVNVEDIFARMAEWRMAQIVGQRERFDQVFVEPKSASNRASDR